MQLDDLSASYTNSLGPCFITLHFEVVLLLASYWKFGQAPEMIASAMKTSMQSILVMLLINVKMPTIVGILAFMSMINTTTERLKARNFFICWYFSFYEQLKFCALLS